MGTTVSLRRMCAVGLITTTLAAGTIPVASAKSSDYRASGTCSKGAVWKLKAKADNARIEVELEVDSNRNGQVWTWALRDNEIAVGSGSATTVAPSGSFSVARRITNQPGNDTITATARHAATGQTCSMRVVFPG